MAQVGIDGVGKSYGHADIIHGVDIDIADGEFTVLVGPSGCGKSTLLRMIAGLESISSGEIRIGGKRVNETLPKDRDIAMVFQNYALYPSKTVAANIGFPLKMRGQTRADISKKVDEAARILGLGDLLGRYPRQLSGGQRQRVAMGRAIVRDPQVFLFDEPLSNLDAKLRVKMRSEIKELHQRLGATMIYVTHDQIEAMTMADRIVVMRAGKVEQIGTPLELYDQPTNMFVASFIGSPSMNFLRGQLDVTAPGATFVSHSGAKIPLPEKPVAGRSGNLTLGIRPEHLEFSASEVPGSFSLQAVVVEPTGPQTQIIARIGADEVTALLNGRFLVRPGETIWLRPSPSSLHFFRE